MALPAHNPRSTDRAIEQLEKEIRELAWKEDSDSYEVKYELLRDMSATEDQRTITLDQKAAIHFGLIAAGTAAFGGILGWMLTNQGTPPFSRLSLLLSLGAFFFLVCSILCSISASWIREYLSIEEPRIFTMADDDLDSKEDFKRFMVSHIWRIVHLNRSLNSRKATWIRRSQGLTFVAIVFLFFFAISVAATGYNAGKIASVSAPALVAEKDKPAPEPKPKPKPPPPSTTPKHVQESAPIKPSEPPVKAPAKTPPAKKK